MLDVCLLGTGGMMPLPRRWLTALMTRYNGSSKRTAELSYPHFSYRDLGYERPEETNGRTRKSIAHN